MAFEFTDNIPLGGDANTLASKTLVLLDFNEFLVFRSKAKQGRGGLHFIGSRPKDYVCGNPRYPSTYYLRPGVRDFIVKLINDPRCDIAIYTSIKKDNMNRVISSFDEYYRLQDRAGKLEEVVVYDGSSVSGHSSLADASIQTFDRDYNAPAPRFGKDWATKRDLSKIFSHRLIKSRGFDCSNTVVLEVEADKMTDWTKKLDPSEAVYRKPCSFKS